MVKADISNPSSLSDVSDLIIEQDTGARNPKGIVGAVLTHTALVWAVFQLWIVSPLQFEFGFFILNDTESRSIHLAFATFLAFTAYPTFRRSPRSYIPIQDWIMAISAAFCSGYLYLFYRELATRPGIPTDMDIYVSAVGIILLLESARRSLGLPLMIMGAIFLSYTFFGSASWMPDMIAHKGQSFNKIGSHMWLTTEGVFGIALGVSSGFVFLFVLFGSLLDKAGAGNYFIKLAFALLGHLRGGPAKAAVLSSALTGFISGSSIANTVTTGTFTIPLMKRVGFSSEKAGAVEVSASVNGQIMPPVMGAAAFIMVEYVGISYQAVIKHAFLPAVISYIALLYMVHLEALKLDMKRLPKLVNRSVYQTLLGLAINITSVIILSAIIYYAIGWVKSVADGGAIYIIAVAMMLAYILLVRFAAKFPDLEVDNPNLPVVKLPEATSTFKTGMHYILPVVMLVWCLMVERLSPGLSAFWACMVMIFILVTQKPLLNYFRGESHYKAAFFAGLGDLQDGMITGSRNMIGIAIATAAAGIIVGTVSLTGIGQVMTQLVEILSGGSLIMVLVLTAIISLILGMGLPTTANYLVVASMMVGVVQELGAVHGLIIPAIAVHLFVFYFGIMADVTPPVGLASFAAAAISKGDPIRTGVQAFVYSLRTAILPFFFIFNTDLLLIGVDSFWQGLVIFVTATIAILLFSAATQGYFFARSKIYESLILLLISITLFVPSLWMNMISPPYKELPGSVLSNAIMQVDAGEIIKLNILGEDDIGDEREFFVILNVQAGDTAEARLKALGLTVDIRGAESVVENLALNSTAEMAGIGIDNHIKFILVPKPQPDVRLMYIPAFILLLLIIIVQKRRNKYYCSPLEGERVKQEH